MKNLLLSPLSSLCRKFESSVCSVVKYFYNTASPHVFYCKVQSDNPR